jgi:Spy/CpxP family protein refolding chaperone
MKIGRILVVLLAAMFFTGLFAAHSSAFGPYSESHGSRGGGYFGLKTLLQMDLSPEQNSKILGIFDKYEKERQPLLDSLREARRNLRRAMRTEPFSEEAFKGAYRQVAGIREELLLMGVKVRSEVKSVLTPQQLQLLKERMAQRWQALKNRRPL